MATKRSVDRGVDHEETVRKKLKFDQIKPSKSSTVEGILSSVSPMRDKYFEGELTDGETSIRIVGFDNDQQQKLASFYREKTPVKISNCEVKKARSSDDCEVLVRKYSAVELSPTRFDYIDDIDCVGSQFITLSCVSKMKQYSKVTVKCKVLKVNPEVIVGTGKRKQEVYIADHTGSTIVTLWERDVGILEEGKSYKLSKVIVQTYNNTNGLSFAVSAVATAVEDIEVDVDQSFLVQPIEMSTVVENVEVASVSTISRMYACLSCKRTDVFEEDGILGKCTRCGTTQKLSKCKRQVTAKLGLILPDDRYVAMKAYEAILMDIVGSDNAVTENNLITAVPFTVSYNNYNVITSISRLPSLN